MLSLSLSFLSDGWLRVDAVNCLFATTALCQMKRELAGPRRRHKRREKVKLLQQLTSAEIGH